MAVDYNVACCHGPDRGDLERSLAELSALRRPAIVMVAGAALGGVSLLADAGWVCIGSDPFMRLALDGPGDGGVPGAGGTPSGGAAGTAAPRLLDSAGVRQLRSVIEHTFAVPSELAEVALPGSAAQDAPEHDPAFEAWGLYEGGVLASGTGLVRTGTSVCVWSMATPPELQGRGYGRRLLSGALRAAAAGGASQCLLIASPAGERLYRALGFDLLEHWQLWTRPRWVLA
jgi:GNAT superfamily N-acetyltransferase